MDIGKLFDLKGKVAIVTGGSRGIGEMIAEGLVSSGVRTYITARKADACDATAERLSAFGECISVPTDLATDDGRAALAARVREDQSHLDILVNNAGAAWGGPIDSFPGAGFDKVLSLNVKAPFMLTQELLPELRAAARADDPARVIMTGSAEGTTVPKQENYSYSASKAGVHMLARHLARRLAPEHITVNTMAPGPFDSKMMAFVLDDPEQRAAVAAGVPLGRIGTPEDVAGAVIFLCSRAGSYLTGATVPVDGGVASLA